MYTCDDHRVTTESKIDPLDILKITLFVQKLCLGKGDYSMLTSLVAQRSRICLPMQKTQVTSLGQEDPMEKEMATTPVFWPGKSHGQKSLMGCSPSGRETVDTT